MSRTDKELATEIVVAMINKDPKLLYEKEGSRITGKDIELSTVSEALIAVYTTLNDLGQSRETE